MQKINRERTKFVSHSFHPLSFNLYKRKIFSFKLHIFISTCKVHKHALFTSGRATIAASAKRRKLLKTGFK